MITIQHLIKSYGTHEVLNIPDLFFPGGKYWIKGAHGSGKSTLLKILAGLLPFKGDVLLNETISIRRHPVQYRSLVNHAPADPVYPSFVSGQQLVDFYCSVKKSKPGQAACLKDILGIDKFLENPVGTYSSGMMKKLSLLLAFIGKPRLILLDEPFTTLDAQTQSALTALIQSTDDTGFLLTSHHEISIHEIHFTGIYQVKEKNLLPE